MARFNTSTSKPRKLTEAKARKPKAKKGRKPLSQAQREQIARYLSGDKGYNSLPD